MNKKTFEVWKVLLDCPNKWLDTSEVAYLSNLTSKQVSSIIVTMPSPPIFKGRNLRTKNLQIVLAAAPDEIRSIRRSVISEYYHITDEMICNVYSAMSPLGWMCIADIACDAGIDRINVTRTLTIVDGVESKEDGSTMLYRRTR